MNNCDIKAELLFLVTKLLEDDGCSEVADYLKRVITNRELFPPRTNVLGRRFANSFENYESVHGPVAPFSIVNHISKLLELVRMHHPYGRPVVSLFNLGNYIYPKERSISIPVSVCGFSPKFAMPLLCSVYQRTHINHHSLAHRNAIYCLQFDQRGEYLFTGSDDYTVKIWSFNAASKKPCALRHTLRGHVAEIIELTISPDNHLLASVDSNCCLVMWCLRTGQPVVAFRGCRANRVISGMTFVSVPRRAEASQNEASLGFHCQSRSGQEHPTGWLAITSFGGYLHFLPYQHELHEDFGVATGSNRWVCCSVKLLPTIRFITGIEGTPTAFWPSVVCMDISPGNLLLATGCSDQYIRLYHFLSPSKPTPSFTLRAHEESVNSVAFSHCGLKLASGSSDGGSCWLWRFQAGKWRSMVLSFRKRIKCRPCLLTWSKNDRYLIASMKNGSVYVYLGDSGHLYTIIEAHEGAVHAMSPSPLDDEFLATGGVDGRFQVWNIKQHHDIMSNDSSNSDMFTPVDSSLSSPLLCYYRYPPSEVDPDHGLIWHPFEPSDNLPIWQNSAVHRRTQREQSHVAQPVFSVRASISQGGRDVPLLTPGSTQTQSQRPIPPTPFRHQRITACRAFPASEGTGFLVVTKSGLLSVFGTNASNGSRTRSQLEMSGSSSIIDLDSDMYAVDEQFFHWELDTAEWREVTMETEDVQTVQTTFALGSPAAPQSVLGLVGARYDRNGRSTRPNPENRVTSIPTRSSSAQQTTPSSVRGLGGRGTSVYRPPVGVCFEVIHAPSRVPFHRLPPPYLTTLRGVPLCLEYQRAVPGRNHLHRPPDLLPSVTADDELGEDMVIDDIQFCSEVPADYCPSPLQSRTHAIQGKHYLWQSVWLNPLTPLIQPLSATELKYRLEEQKLLYEEEFKFFVGNGDSRVTFGDEFINSVPKPDQCVFMQPVVCPGLCSLVESGTVSQTSSLETLSRKDCIEATGQLGVENPAVSASANPALPLASGDISAPETVNTAFAPSQSIDSTQAISANLNHLIDEAAVLSDENEDQSGTSEESEWSQNIDVDIGWWHRQHRRRHRRNAATEGAAANPNQTRRVTVTSRSRGNGSRRSENRRTRMIQSARGTARWRRSNLSVSGQRRRSTRQQRLARCRAQQDRRLAHLRVEREKHFTKLRRSQRTHGQCSLDSAGNISQASTRQSSGHEDIQATEQHLSNSPNGSEANTSTVLDTTMTESDVLNERRERLKRRLLCSLDFLLRTANRVPLAFCPPGGYSAPDCEGLTYPSENLPGVAGERSWSGPHFDWLSTYHPIPSPYVPQIGDRIIYVRRGHQEYIRQAWQTGQLPKPDSLRCVSSTVRGTGETVSSSSAYSPELPWDIWPHIPDYVCGEVQSISYTVVRITTNSECHPNRHHGKRHKSPGWRKQQRARGATHIRASDKHSQSHSSSCSRNSDTSETKSDESFIRLVTLHVKLESEQPYAYLGSAGSSRYSGTQQPECLSITYHDVDGILEFVVLRHLFDKAMQHRWCEGDRFVCPVGTTWWRGRIIGHVSEERIQSLTEPTPCCSKTKLNQPNPWLSLLVRWMHSSETGLEPFTTPPMLIEPESTTSVAADRLSPWDCYPWDLINHPTSVPGEPTENRTVSIEDQSLRALFGTPCTSYETKFAFREYDLHGHCKRLLGCFDKLARLPVSEFFTAPVDLATYPDYLFVNPCPIDLGLIMARLSTGFYRQSAAVQADLQLLLDNTVRYNQPSSNIVRNARLVYQIASQFISDSRLSQRDVQRLCLKFEREMKNSDPQAVTSPTAQVDVDVASVSGNSSTVLVSHDSLDELDATCRPRVVNAQTPQLPHDPSETQSTVRPLRRTRYQLQSPTRRVIPSVQSSLPNTSREFCNLCAHLLPANWVPTCLNLIKSLTANQHSLFFRNPIDMEEYPDYLSIVSCPMDLSSIQKRLSATMSIVSRLRHLRSVPQGAYRCPHECISDLNLMISNSRLYNEDPETAVFADTEWLHKWVSEVFVPHVSTIIGLPNSSLSEGIHEVRSFSNDDIPPRTQRRHTAKPRLRQSKLACRKLALRKARNTLIRRGASSKRLDNRGYTVDDHPTPDSPYPVRTSSGRVVRPPSRNSQTIFFVDCSDGSEDFSDPNARSGRASKSRKRLHRAINAITTAATTSSESSLSSTGRLSRWQNKRRRRTRMYL
ncbi:Bromodomain and WD repeat-containing protein 1 [Clonorchis sinensis]|uniref:Bromodomain and WD repeat-containing protein 1 n=1 Tax=Clonorchis sinensis TaxID=79923 RepID=A0A8T1MGT5_CLOSI|nr:Bromodomain and WD repeat-containing protein 1 [Clonorchis sinensis]